MNAGQTGGKLNTYDPMSKQGGHAVALVGYDPGMFIVRNSWGDTGWGDKGFAYASNVYAAAAFTEAYGMNVV
jgi:C1A family cysteine protease